MIAPVKRCAPFSSTGGMSLLQAGANTAARPLLTSALKAIGLTDTAGATRLMS